MEIFLKPKEDRRIKKGHCWVFSNEIKTATNGLKAGDVVKVFTNDNKFLGMGLYNPNSLISVRIYSRIEEEIDSNWFSKKLKTALKLRQKLFKNNNSYRLIHSESDGIPGVIIDRFEKVFSVQISSIGMEQRKELLFAELMKFEGIEGIAERGESNLRVLEGLPIITKTACGVTNVQSVSDGFINYEIDPLAGQKTGFYLDQRENRIAMRKFFEGSRVLDLFSNSGGFALHASQCSASEVIAVESSEEACNFIQRNTELNKLSGIEICCSDVFVELKKFKNKNERFDCIIADPPPFARSKKHEANARKKYVELFEECFTLTNPMGVVFLATCSHNITSETFFEMLREASYKANREVLILETRAASPDHLVHSQMPETAYLRAAIVLVK